MSSLRSVVNALRMNGSSSFSLMELRTAAILAHWAYMWRFRQPAAQGAGVNPEVLADLGAGIHGPKIAIVLVVAHIEHGGNPPET
jgi:hypothetical protein